MPSLIEEFQKTWLTSLIGLGLLCLGVFLLTWNEGRAVYHAHSLDETFNNAIALNPYEPIRPELDDRVVYISAPLTIDEPLTEPEYSISIQAVKLRRRVQMYQWVEERTPRDDFNEQDSIAAQHSSHDYYYVTEWRDKLVDSSTFYIRHGHQNPLEMPLKSHIYVAPTVKVGPLTLGSEIKQKFSDWIEVTSDERPERKDVKLHMGIYYHCDDVWNPEVGDIRVQFYYAGSSGEPVSIIAKQKDGNLVPYTTSKGHDIALLRHGNLNINDIFNAEHHDARLETWKLRGIGTFAVYAGSVCLARILKILLLRLPLLRSLISSDMASFQSLILSVSVSLVVIAFTWIFYRPILGASLILAAFSPFFYCAMGVYNMAQNGYNTR